MAINTRRVEAFMKLHGLTQKAVAKENGVSQPFVSYFIRGRRTSERLSEYFISQGCPKVDIYGDEHDQSAAV